MYCMEQKDRRFYYLCVLYIVQYYYIYIDNEYSNRNSNNNIDDV